MNYDDGVRHGRNIGMAEAVQIIQDKLGVDAARMVSSHDESNVHESMYKTLRHIETVRNYIGTIVKELMIRAETHDQSKLEPPEAEMFNKYTHLLRGCTYNSEEYKGYLVGMGEALNHHYLFNRHHPEYFRKHQCISCNTIVSIGHDIKKVPCTSCGNTEFKYVMTVSDMNLIDIIEMLCDWKAATLRHDDGSIYQSLEDNQARFGYSDELKEIMLNTIKLIHDRKTFHKAKES